jgi:hypothetical protein
MIVAAIKGAISSVHGAETADKKISEYYLSEEIRIIAPGMLIAIPDEHWRIFRKYTQSQFAKALVDLASNLKLTVTTFRSSWARDTALTGILRTTVQAAIHRRL